MEKAEVDKWLPFVMYGVERLTKQQRHALIKLIKQARRELDLNYPNGRFRDKEEEAKKAENKGPEIIKPVPPPGPKIG